jgi:hypothetical protein
MLESPEQIQAAIALMGERVTFPALLDVDNNVIRASFSTYAVPGVLVFDVQDYSSPADLSKKETHFRLPSKVYIEKGIERSNSFTYTPSNTPERTFTFTILSSFDDYTGWITMTVKLSGVA